MSINLSDLNNIEKANENYLTGLELLQTSCIKCRCNPNYMDAIPYFKKAADIYHGCGKFQKEIIVREKLVKCFENERSFWEEGNEYEKISKVQLNQLKQVSDAENSIMNSFNAYASNRSYDDGIKALTKSSNEFIDTDNKDGAIKILDFAFQGIEKYYHILTLNKDDSHHYIYECIDKYIDLLFGEEDYEKCAQVALKSYSLIKRDQKDEKRMICKYYGFQAIAELLSKKEDKYQETVQQGIEFEENTDDFCSKINRLVNVVKQKHKDNEKLIKRLFSDISRKVPTSVAKMINVNFIQVNAVNEENSEIKTNLSEEEDLK
jgi:tetratricopeptide (TPR) repeat protein